jgi:hypothetical protein
MFGKLKKALTGAASAHNDELLQGVMEVLKKISREELEAVCEEWLLRSDRCIPRKGEYVEEREFNYPILIVSVLFRLAMLKLSGTPCNRRDPPLCAFICVLRRPWSWPTTIVEPNRDFRSFFD